ncbi:MAG TPA: HAD family hydrolase [Ktedonobacteraceae bacterium]
MPEKRVQALAGRVIRCILFDFGDTLWYRGDVHAWKQLETAANQRAVTLLRKHVAPAYLPALDDLTLGQRLREAFDENVRAAIQRNPGFEANGPRMALQALRAWGIEDANDALGNAIFEALRVRIPESRPLFKDTHSTLAALQQRGFLLGVVSNRLWGGEPFHEDVQSLGLFKYFEPRAVAISADLGIRKPNPAIFLHALDALNVSPHEAVMVGDSLRADIVGGLNLGIFTVWKPKPLLRSRVKAHMRGAGHSSTSMETLDSAPSEPGTQIGVTSSTEVSQGMHVTDDDYMLAQLKSRDSLDQFFSDEIKPDLIIEHLSELLDVFREVGMQ